ncbi:MAG: cbb3-type cytochrome c oxidase subunit 3 [Spongiibacteraceae bacterium]|jgi:cytochrome c oxidase cbb3-type subunit 4|nr:cbb3-type cytochrome c oxidase subunit 3 [Spongiibacteraceae bacterium]
MDIDTLRAFSTIPALIAFLAICAWTYSSRRKGRFEEAAQAPFADEHLHSQPSAVESSTGKQNHE